MRVIAGSARGRTLLSPTGNRVRPTADRVKEALFSSLQSRFGSFSGLAVLDLFAGSGGLGIEALSRGAESALFVDSHPESLRLIGKNLVLTGLEGAATTLRTDALQAVADLGRSERRFDIIFADPPYRERELIDRLLQRLTAAAPLSPDGMIVLESDTKTDLNLPEGLLLVDRRVYGDTALWFLSRGQ